MKSNFIKTLLIFVIIFSLHFQVKSQKLKTDLFKNMKARAIGPAAMSGRITSIDAVVSNPDIIYAGAASGGVWKTENGGTTWTSIFDENPIINIGAIAIQQSNPSVVWVGTGEGNPRNSVNLGAGIYKSLDGGKTWKSMGLEKTKNIHRVIIDPTNPNVVYVGAIGNPFADHPERGVFKTIDGGLTWEKILFTNEHSGVGDMVMDPTNPNKLFVGMWDHHRTTYDFKSGGKGSGFYVTIDGGKNWTKLTNKLNGIPEGDLGRIGVAVSKSEPNRVYALIESSKNALYRSDNGGFKWEKINDDDAETIKGNRPFYFWDIAVDPKNENRVYGIFQMISMSEDGGKSFKVIVPYEGVHPDHHAFWIHPEDPSFIINGNDGGVAISRDRGRKWSYTETLPLGQFYHINVDSEMPYNVYGGLQDNGSWRGPAYTWQNGDIRSWHWQTVLGGDGFDVIPDNENIRYGYAMSQGGSLARYDSETGADITIKPTAPDLKTRLRFNWNAGIAIDPIDKKTVYYGSQFLHKSSDKGMNWEIISPDLTTDNKTQQKASDESGGITIDLTSAENHNTILCIAPSPVKQGVIWVGTDDGNVQITQDGGKTWSNVTPKISGLPKESWIPQIRASSFSGSEAFVVANNYRQGDMSAYIFRTEDFGQTWTRLVDDKKVVGYALAIQQDIVEPKLMFVGTEQGLWVSVDEGANFTQWKAGFPPVSTMDLAIQEREADLVIATFGRAIYVLDDIRPLRQIAANNGKILDKKIAAFDQQIGYMANYRDAAGASFAGDANYSGENRKKGFKLNYFYNPPKKDTTLNKKNIQSQVDNKIQNLNVKGTEKGKKKLDEVGKEDFPIATTSTATDTTKKATMKYDTVYVKIYNAENKLIRTLQHKPDSVGYQSVMWNMTEKGIRNPGVPKPKKNAADANGLDVLAGKYKVVFMSGDAKDSTIVEVKDDPRILISKETRQAQKVLFDRMAKSINQLTEATDRLSEAEDVAKMIQNQAKEKEGKEFEDLAKASKTIQDSIKIKREIILGKKMEKQGYGRPYQLTPQGKIREAMGYVSSRQINPTKDDINLVEQLEVLTKDSIEKINKFFATTWTEYRKKTEATPMKTFKDYAPIGDGK
jgi:photosystem II stability/assembly factor-like uncharacterized protein